MSYLRAYIDQCPAYGWQGGPEFKTLIVQMASGLERRNAMWANAWHRFTIPFNNISRDGYRGIKQMHLLCRGRTNVFQFVDQLDNDAVDEVFGEGDGVQTVFQLCKISSIDGVFYQRNVYVIQPGASITDNGSPVSPTIDYDRGTVTFAVAPTDGHILRWTGNFALWVRFDNDFLPFSIENGNAVDKFASGSVDLKEVQPPGIGE